MLSELHVVVRVHVPLVVVCDEAVVRRTLGLIALVVIVVVVVVAIFPRILLYWRYTVYISWSLNICLAISDATRRAHRSCFEVSSSGFLQISEL